MGLPVKVVSSSFAFNFDSNVCLLLDGVQTLQDLGTGNVIVAGLGDQTIQAPRAALIFANEGAETVQDGSATLVPGPGGGTFQLGGNAHVVSNDPCEMVAGMVLQAGSGSKLTTPLPVSEMVALGVTVQGFTEVVIAQNSCKSQCVDVPDCSGHGQCIEGAAPGEVECECDEALSAGLPVLISGQTPWGEVEQQGVGWCLPLSELERFAEVIDEVAAWPEETLSKVSEAACSYARKIAEKDTVLEDYRRLFLKAMQVGVS